MAWGYKATITIDADQVSGSGDMTDFPVLIKGTYDGTGSEPDLRSTANGGKVTSASGYDIGFYSDSDLSTALSFELESYTASTGAIVFWVKIPTLDYDNDTVIYMAYGDASITTNQSSTATWNSNYGGVWHCNNDPSGSAPQIIDSTSNDNDGTVVGSGWDSGDLQDGKINKSIHITPATDQYINCGSVPDPVSNKICYSSWFYLDSDQTGADPDFCFLSSGDAANMAWLSYDGSTIYTKIRLNNTNINNVDISKNKGEWILMHMVYDGTNAILYVNGSLIDSVTTSITLPTSKNLWIGAYGSSRVILGLICESRYLTTSLTTDWITTEYNNQNSPSTFYAVGSETVNDSGGSRTAAGERIAAGARTLAGERTAAGARTAI